MRIKRTGETGRINATDGGVVYVRMDGTNESKVFSAFVDEEAAIELVLPGVVGQREQASEPDEKNPG